ncbi:MAG: response regulator [Proteobacteria bacterium]|nr:response regulator [Pseudomonadota bacterium]
MNLQTNAKQAMENEGGRISINLKPFYLDPGPKSSLSHLSSGEYAQLTISDTGVGMDLATLDQIFEPFYTTKAVGRGTGFGLSVAHGIIKSHQGEIRVGSTLGVGTTFAVFLPITDTEPSPQTKIADGILRGNEQILLVDDEEINVGMLAEMLEDSGYAVEKFTSSEKALEAFSQNSDKYDLVLSDLTMPGLTGTELAQKIKSIKNSIPFILITGYFEVTGTGFLEENGIQRVLSKPIVVKELTKAIREVLD